MNSKQARNSSRAFHLAAARCNEMKPLPGGQVETLAVPAIVCEAFSIELALKALLLDAMKSHDLKKLFDGLDASIQKKIVAATGIEEKDFHASLSAAAKAFDEWRYVHEKETLSISTAFLSTLAKAAQHVLNK
ncbi:MAG: hypothetical protein M1527_06760 [Gammaproteobacteria bacterium]|nr:hypothetical protein [Gammaproteobacteria bacterium]